MDEKVAAKPSPSKARFAVLEAIGRELKAAGEVPLEATLGEVATFVERNRARYPVQAAQLDAALTPAREPTEPPAPPSAEEEDARIRAWASATGQTPERLAERLAAAQRRREEAAARAANPWFSYPASPWSPFDGRAPPGSSAHPGALLLRHVFAAGLAVPTIDGLPRPDGGLPSEYELAAMRARMLAAQLIRAAHRLEGTHEASQPTEIDQIQELERPGNPLSDQAECLAFVNGYLWRGPVDPAVRRMTFIVAIKRAAEGQPVPLALAGFAANFPNEARQLSSQARSAFESAASAWRKSAEIAAKPKGKKQVSAWPEILAACRAAGFTQGRSAPALRLEWQAYADERQERRTPVVTPPVGAAPTG